MHCSKVALLEPERETEICFLPQADFLVKEVSLFFPLPPKDWVTIASISQGEEIFDRFRVLGLCGHLSLLTACAREENPVPLSLRNVSQIQILLDFKDYACFAYSASVKLYNRGREPVGVSCAALMKFRSPFDCPTKENL